MPRLSAFIIAKNEAGDITGCLESLQGLADEIVVVDDHSTDATVELCRRFDARIFQRRLESFGAQKQYALDQTTGDWLLSIDADERVTPALAQEIRSKLSESHPADGYKIRRNNYFLGTRLRFGGVGSDWVLRLFKRGSGQLRRVKVHEGIIVEGRVEKLREPLDHFSYASLQEYLEKCNHYTTLAAQDLWTRPRRFSYWAHLRLVWELLVRVVLKGAWLDGHPGLIYAMLSAYAAWLRAIKLWEIEKNENQQRPHRETAGYPAGRGPMGGGGK